MSALRNIKDAGFNLSVSKGMLRVVPFSKLTKQQWEFLKQHKAEIIEVLQFGQDKLPAMKFEVLKNQIVRALRLRGDDEENIREVINDCQNDYDKTSWPELYDYFEKVEQKHTLSEEAKCKNCRNWAKDHIGDGTGLGRCDVQSQILAWPGNVCSAWKGVEK